MKLQTEEGLETGWGMEECNREGGRETQEGGDYGDMCIRIADALCYTAETNTPL